MKAAIVGAGLMGRLLAFYLLEQGWQISLFDLDNKKGKKSCSYAAAGMLSPIYELEKTTLWIAEMGLHSMALWKDIINKLSYPIFFQEKGSLVISHSLQKNDLNYLIQKIKFKKINNDEIKHLSFNEIKQLEPEIKEDISAFHFTTEGQIDCQALLSSLTQFFQNKIDWKEKQFVTKIYPGKIEVSNQTECFDWVFDCRGLGAQKDINGLRGMRGELIWLYAPEVNLTRPIRYFHPRYPLYILPRPGNIYLVGASEIENNDKSPISVRSTLELLTAAYSIHEGFAEAKILKTVVNVRPVFLDHLPKIFFQRGLCIINGLYRHGYLISPALVHEVLSLINYGKSSMRFPQLLGDYND